MTKKVAKSQEDMVISQRDAQRLVADKEIAEAFEAIKDGYIAAWSKTKPAETELRELAYQHFKAVSDVWAALQAKAHSAHVRDLNSAAEASNG